MDGETRTATLPRGPLTQSSFFDHRLAVLAIGMFAIGTDSFVIAGMLVEIAQELDVSVAAAGQLITVYALCYAVFTPIAAVATANWPRQRVLLTGLLIFVIGNIIAGFGSSFLLVLFGRAVSGLGAALFAPMASATAAAIVNPAKRASALAVMMTALSIAGAFGAPIGTLIGTLFSWRLTFALIAAIATLAAFGVAIFVKCEGSSVWLSLRERMRPIRDRRILLTLCATFLVLCGLYMPYTYIGVVFDRATQGDGVILALLISFWGLAGTVGAIASGRLTDRIGSRIVINATLTLLAIDFAFLPWTSASFGTSAIAMIVWGFCGLGFVIPQQHRLIELAPQFAPILLGLYTMAVYGGASVSGAIGAVAYTIVGFYQLPLIGAGLIVCGLVVSEYLGRKISADARD
jgi:predicted MFS family arabinose efflux permease